MRATRYWAAGPLAALVLATAACGGGDNEQPVQPDGTHTSHVTADAPQGPKPGDVSVPKMVAVGDIPSANAVSGVTMVMPDIKAGCTVLGYGGGLRKLGEFTPFTKQDGSIARRSGPCLRHYFTRDYSTRLAVVDGTIYKQSAGGKQEKVPVTFETMTAVLGPDDRIYTQNGRGFRTHMVSLDLNGSDVQKVEDEETSPQWAGGKMVYGSAKIVSNPDGSLAVEYKKLATRGGYKIGPVVDGRGSISSKVVFAEGNDALPLMAWAHDNVFVTADRDTIYSVTATAAAGDQPATAVVKAIATLPADYTTGAPSPVSDMVSCQGEVYFAVSVGGTQALPENQSVLLRVNADTGELTALSSVQQIDDQPAIVGCAG